jgi:hypothetical protein
MPSPLLTDLAEFVSSLPVGATLDAALKADLLGRIVRAGSGAPQAAGGSAWGALTADLVGPAGRYPAPAGPAGPPPPPPPPVSPHDPPEPTE